MTTAVSSAKKATSLTVATAQRSQSVQNVKSPCQTVRFVVTQRLVHNVRMTSLLCKKMDNVDVMVEIMLLWMLHLESVDVHQEVC